MFEKQALRFTLLCLFIFLAIKKIILIYLNYPQQHQHFESLGKVNLLINKLFDDLNK